VIIPDRLAIDQSSEFWAPLAGDSNLKVELNGIPQTAVLEYCVSEGWLIRYKTPITVVGDKLATEKMHGLVTVYYGSE
jgi:hypothetical protein